MKTKHIFRMMGMLILLAALLASQTSALAAPMEQTTGPTATVQRVTGPTSLAVSANLSVGQTVTYSINLQNIPSGGYTSAEFACRYDPALVSIANFVDAGLFGAGAVSTVNGPAGGTFIYAIAGVSGNKATVDGTAFSFDVTTLAGGSFTLDCRVRAANGATLISVAFTPITITITDPKAPGTVTGTVIASKTVTITLLSGTTTVTTATAAANGTFSISAAPGTYTIRASAPGFLNAEGPVTIPGGGSTSKPSISLLAGDVNGDGAIDKLDVATLGLNYNLATPAAADFNNDGVINLLDLQILAANYLKTGPTAW